MDNEQFKEFMGVFREMHDRIVKLEEWKAAYDRGQKIYEELLKDGLLFEGTRPKLKPTTKD